MVTAVDTNVLSAMLAGNEKSSLRAVTMLRSASEVGEMQISPVVFAELSAAPKASHESISELLKALRIEVDWELGEEVWREAAAAFRTYAERR
ncbi:MAG: type II toxin-antitoxin system VapC family toxin [Trueperaceae bacterium]